MKEVDLGYSIPHIYSPKNIRITMMKVIYAVIP